MWDGHPGQISMGKHLVELTSEDHRPVHSAPYRAGPRASDETRPVHGAPYQSTLKARQYVAERLEND